MSEDDLNTIIINLHTYIQSIYNEFNNDKLYCKIISEIWLKAIEWVNRTDDDDF